MARLRDNVVKTSEVLGGDPKRVPAPASESSLASLQKVQAKRLRLREALGNFLGDVWRGMGAVDPINRQAAGKPGVIEGLAAYGRDLYDAEAEQIAELALSPEQIRDELEKIQDRVTKEMFDLEFYVDTFFHLPSFKYDLDYRACIVDSLNRRQELWAGHYGVREEPKDVRPKKAAKLIDEYCKREKLTIQAFAKKVRVDASVIYALKRGVVKAGRDALARTAELLGCQVEDLLPD